MIHIHGMGWLGSTLAFRLEQSGVPFTWHDTERDVQAWRASTGLVYPAGDERSVANMGRWAQWIEDGVLPAGTVERVAYVYAHKNPPHGGRYDTRELSGGLHEALAPCYSVNVPGVVNAARERFAACRLDGPGPGRQVIAHGFTDRLVTVMWGWATPIELDLPEGFPARPALYGRPHRFQMVYAFPAAGRPNRWWAGSSLTAQKYPASRLVNAATSMRRWLDAFPTLYPGVGVRVVGDTVEGWRPRPANSDDQYLRHSLDGTITFPPLWHSGVRWAPELIDGAVEALR